jgi:hypothetical protein
MRSLLLSSSLALALVSLLSGSAQAQVYPGSTGPLVQASRGAMVAGVYTFTFANAYNITPVCVVTGESSLVNILDVTPSTSSCTITSSSVLDVQMVDVIVVGNPN